MLEAQPLQSNDAHKFLPLLIKTSFTPLVHRVDSCFYCNTSVRLTVRYRILVLAVCVGVVLLTGCFGDEGRRSSPFEVPVAYPAGKKPVTLVAYDVNADGYPDLLTPNAEGDTLRYFEGLGDGSFKDPVVMKTGREPLALEVNDFNGDGIGDIAVCNYGDDDLLIIEGQKDGMFVTKGRFKTGRLPIAIDSADFNNDGIVDLAVSLRFDKLVIHLGVGDGSFKLGEAYKATGTPAKLVTGDFNNDGNVDIAIASNAVKADFIKVYLGNGDGTLEPGRRFTGGKQSNYIAAHDVNLDGNLDILIVSPLADSVTLFLNDGKGNFSPQPDLAGEKGPQYVAQGEFTDDKIPDLIISNKRDNSISILEGRGDGTFLFPHFNFPVGPGPRALTVADFNNDGLHDLALVLYQREMIEVLIRSRTAPGN